MNNNNYNNQNPQQYGYFNNNGQPLNPKKKGISTGGIVAIVIGAVTSIALLFISSLILVGFLAKNIESYVESYYSLSEGIVSKPDGFYGKIFTFIDDSTLYLNDNGTYLWYKDNNIKNDNYFEGTFVVASGVAAENMIINDLSSYGVTNKELQEFYSRNEGTEFSQEHLVCIVMTSTKRIINKTNVLKANDVVPYMGFYNEESYSLANMKSGEFLTVTSVEDQ